MTLLAASWMISSNTENLIMAKSYSTFSDMAASNFASISGPTKSTKTSGPDDGLRGGSSKAATSKGIMSFSGGGGDDGGGSKTTTKQVVSQQTVSQDKINQGSRLISGGGLGSRPTAPDTEVFVAGDPRLDASGFNDMWFSNIEENTNSFDMEEISRQYEAEVDSFYDRVRIPPVEQVLARDPSMMLPQITTVGVDPSLREGSTRGPSSGAIATGLEVVQAMEVSVTEPTRNIYALEGPEAAMSAAATSLRKLDETLDQGSSGQQVRNVQYRLSALGYDTGRGGTNRLQKDDNGNWRYWDNSEMRGVDGSYGPSVAAAVREFQEDAGLEPTGIVDTATASAMANAEPVRFRPLDTGTLNDVQKTNYTELLEAAQEENIQGVELAALMAQARHESADFRLLREGGYSYQRAMNTSGWPERLRAHNVTAQNATPERIFNAVYANMNGNGNFASGDGNRYRGRGQFQITGRANYRAAGEALGVDLESNPELLESNPTLAAQAAIWYWTTRVRPQAPDFNDIERVTKVVNGGFNGLDDRKKYYDQFAVRFNENPNPSTPTSSPLPTPRPNTQE